MTKTIQHSSSKTAGTNQQLLPITKSEYLQFLACQPEFWYYKHCPEEFEGPPDEEALHIMQQGNAIEALARDYFQPSRGLKIKFQQTFQSAELLARADIILTDLDTGMKTLIEVKSGTSVKPEYIDDLAFQVIAAEAAGIWIGQISVLYVNSSYIHSGDIDISKLFILEDVTKQVKEQLTSTRKNIERALAYLEQPEPKIGLHEYCGQKLACPAYQLQHPNLPEYSVFHISRISQAKLQDLLGNGLVNIHQVPRDFKLSDKQRLQVNVAQTNTPHICHNSIHEALDGLQFPLYFLDYESLHYAIPQFDGVKPYQQMVFQWSLHILYADEQEPVHLDFLSNGSTHPALEFARTLHATIPYNGGSVLVWNKSFEMTRNNELGEMYPEYATFFTDINARVFDLMEIFQKQHYVHPACKGSYSIKDVLPVLVPHLSYAELEINHGMLASIRWFELATGKIMESEKERILKCLRQYCKLDTLAMVELYKSLRNIPSK